MTRTAQADHSPRDDEEHVVLLDDDGNAVGSQAKRTVHHQHTPLHLAFSCYVFDRAGLFLVTQRAATKRTWPSVWTNSLCGHPQPGEDIGNALQRRARDELGITLSGLRLALPMFRYRAVMPDGVVEHELCPVFTAWTDDTPHVDPAEVSTLRWTPWGRFVRDARAGGRGVSPWCVEQIDQLTSMRAHPRDIADAEWSSLPAAARHPR